MSRFHPLRVAQVHQETRDTIVLGFAVPDALQEAFRFVQGQHLTLRATIGGEDTRRSYSICSAVQDARLQVAIKRVADGVFSSWANDTLKAGDVIDVMPPMGHFHVPLAAGNRKHYLAFAVGSGITPLLSIIKTTLLSEPGSVFTLVYGNRASSAVIFRDALAELKDQYLTRFRLIYVMSREQQDVDLFNGRITHDKCRQFFASWIDLGDIDTAFICGPQQMMQDVSQALQEGGLRTEQIKVELFAASAPRRAHVPGSMAVAGSQACAVTMIQDGVQVNFSMDKDRESVLDAALKLGIEMHYACKAGVCSTCRCKVVEGRVDMDANHALEDYEVARGFALACQSFPVSDRLVLDFDQDH